MSKGKHIDLSNIKRNQLRNCYDWEGSIGSVIPFSYKDMAGEFILLRIENNKLVLSLNGEELQPITTKSVRECKLGDILKKLGRDNEMFEEYFYSKSKNWIFLDKYVGSSRKYKFQCRKCNHIVTTHIATAFNDNCPSCEGYDSCNFDYHNSLYVTRSDLRRFFVGEFDMLNLTEKSYKTVNLVCPDCKTPRTMNSSILAKQGFTCKHCSDNLPYGEKLVFHIIKQLAKHYDIYGIEREYSPEWAEGKRYDLKFCHDDSGYIIETDGGFHFEDNQMSRQSVELAKEVDKLKEDLALANGFAVIRIDTHYKHESRFNYIRKNIQDSELRNIFDLTIIEWEEAHLFALDSLATKCCILKRNNPLLSPQDIAKEIDFVVSGETVRRYLKQGAEIGLCVYEAKEEIYGKTRVGDIFVYKDGKKMNPRPYYSIRQLCEDSVPSFGVEFSSTSLSRILRLLTDGEQSATYKGYTFSIIRNIRRKI